MTRAEYEKKYGTSTPVQMTRAEYDAKYAAPKTNLFSEIMDTAQQGIQQGVQGIEQINSGQGNPITTGLSGALKVGSGVATTLFSPLAPAINRTVVPAFNAATSKLAETQPFKSYGQAAAYNPDRPLGERILEDLVNAGNTAGGILGAEGIAKAPAQVADATTNLAQMLTKRSEESINAAITNNFDKGVKPLINNKSTPTKVAAYKDDVLTAVKAIEKNKDNLTFTDEYGDAITGQTPKSIAQLSEALEQTKKSIFSQYDALSKQAGEAGVTVKTAPIADELDAVISNKALNLTNPSAVEYAQSMKARYANAGELDTVTTQDVIQNYNKSLEAFYRTPTYETASKAAIDALIVNKLRQALDEGVTSMTGESYSALKGQYKALKTIERDVVKASLREARKNVKGLIDFTDILSGGQVVNGLMSMNPATIAHGLAGKAIAEFYKHLNDPNRAIQKMFDASQRLSQSNTSGKSLLQTQANPSVSATTPTNAIAGTVQEAAPKATPASKNLPPNTTPTVEFNEGAAIPISEQVTQLRAKQKAGTANYQEQRLLNMLDEAQAVQGKKTSLLDKARQFGSFLKDNIGKDQRGFINIFGGGKLSKTQIAAIKAEMKDLQEAMKKAAPTGPGIKVLKQKYDQLKGRLNNR